MAALSQPSTMPFGGPRPRLRTTDSIDSSPMSASPTASSATGASSPLLFTRWDAMSSSPASRSASRSTSRHTLNPVDDRPLTPPVSVSGPRHHFNNGGPAPSSSLKANAPPRVLPRVPSVPGGGSSEVSDVRRLAAANASTSSLAGTKDGSRKEKDKEKEKDPPSRRPKPADDATPPPHVRNTPRLCNVKDVPRASASVMYWSRAPVWGTLPNHSMRAHSVTPVDNVAWLFGGCDDTGCWKDVWCLNTDTMQWTHPEMQGDLPPPCRAHTATLVDRKLVIFGGGEGPTYYNAAYVLDLPTRRWTRLSFPDDAPLPPPRRAHTAVFYRGKIWIFGGGNGSIALNDVWTLDVSGIHAGVGARWEQVSTGRKGPSPRGYHTANLIGHVMIIVGGSDGRDCFSDIWALDLDATTWTQIRPDQAYRRLSHASTQVGSYLFITGGHDGTEYLSDLLLFNLVSLQFESRPTSGKPPPPRGYHVSLLADSRLFVFGGFSGSDVYDDVHMLELAAAAYLPQVTSFRIEA